MPLDSIPQLLLRAVDEFDKQDGFKYKEHGTYVPISHREVLSWVHQVALGLESLGIERGSSVALLSENRFEWVIADLATLTAGCINVPIYSTLPAIQIEYILRDSRSRAIFVSDAMQLEKIFAVAQALPHLEHIIVFDEQCAGDRVITLQQLRKRGASRSDAPGFKQMIAPIEASDRASIIYTSGTTGSPKGAILSHWNFISNVESAASLFDIGPSDTCLSFLPLSHALERMAGYYIMLYCGATIAYAESIDTVPQNFLEVRPTVMVSVPRLYEKMYARVMQNATSGSLIKKYLFFWALKTGKQYVHAHLEGRVTGSLRRKYKIASRLVFSKLKARTGGRMRFFVSGGAPLLQDIAEFFYAAGLPVLEGYGLTETSPVIAVNTFQDFKFGTVGKALPGLETRVADDGELLVKGPNVMEGYFNQPEHTAETIVDGWLHTGDIVSIDPEGFITITDRKKDIVVTASGKNIAPQPIENVLKSSKYISQAVLVGNKRKFISAIIVPNFENLLRLAKAARVPFTDLKSLIASPLVVAKIEKEIERKSAHLAGFEQIKKFILLDKDFSIETDELTPTLKVKRDVIEQKFKHQIDALYAEDL